MNDPHAKHWRATARLIEHDSYPSDAIWQYAEQHGLTTLLHCRNCTAEFPMLPYEPGVYACLYCGSEVDTRTQLARAMCNALHPTETP